MPTVLLEVTCVSLQAAWLRELTRNVQTPDLTCPAPPPGGGCGFSNSSELDLKSTALCTNINICGYSFCCFRVFSPVFMFKADSLGVTPVSGQFIQTENCGVAIEHRAPPQLAAGPTRGLGAHTSRRLEIPLRSPSPGLPGPAGQTCWGLRASPSLRCLFTQPASRARCMET